MQPGPERQESRRPTRPPLPVCPGNAALQRRRRAGQLHRWPRLTPAASSRAAVSGPSSRLPVLVQPGSHGKATGAEESRALATQVIALLLRSPDAHLAYGNRRQRLSSFARGYGDARIHVTGTHRPDARFDGCRPALRRSSRALASALCERGIVAAVSGGRVLRQEGGRPGTPANRPAEYPRNHGSRTLPGRRGAVLLVASVPSRGSTAGRGAVSSA